MDRDDRIFSYLGGMLEPAERSAFERELEGSEALRRELGEARALRLALLETPTAVPPPPALKRKLLERIDRDAPGTQPVRSRPSVFSMLFRYAPAMAAGMIAIAGLGISWQMRSELDTVRSALAAAQSEQTALATKLQSADARIASLSGQLEAAQGATAQLRAQIESSESSLRVSQQQSQAAQAAIGAMQREFDVLMQPNVRLANIPASADPFKQGVATVFFAPQSRTAVLSVANLPPLKPEQTYQVWLIKGANLETRLPSVIFNTSASGAGRVVVLSNEPFENFVAFGITVEPAGGRPVPNPEGPIFVGKLG